jgi:NADP-reducing hydrogenase subunit HndD
LLYETGGFECRDCVVEVEGRRNLAPACKTVCEEGMKVQTHTVRVVNARRTVMELILSDHPAECLTCAKSGECDLQAVAQKLGIREIHYEGEQSHYKSDQSPAIIRDMD